MHDLYEDRRCVESGKSFYNGDTRTVPNEPGKKFLRALDPNTGKIVWEVPQTGQGRTWGGVLATDGGVLFYGADNGDFAAVDAKSGSCCGASRRMRIGRHRR